MEASALENDISMVTSPEFPAAEDPIEVFRSAEIAATHPAEADLFARHEGIPAHDQKRLAEARIVLVGAGGLNSWAGVGLARSGARSISVIDDDRVDRTNLSRQFFDADDLGRLKGKALAQKLARQAVGGAVATGVGLNFEEILEAYPLPADIFVAGVDNNECRMQVVREARRRNIPAVFTMLSRDGMRCQTFLQSASTLEPCLWCALPNLNPEQVAPCASAIISSCLMASAFTIFFTHRAIMGWGNIPYFNWRESDLSGIAPDRTGVIKRRDDCTICSKPNG
jgi:molybdopterin/thiamine biosynthesis adenylyltransferase